jgi:hypothetical protein
MAADGRRDAPWSRLIIGIVILTAGVIFWLDQIDRIDASDYLEWWPVAVIVAGLAHLPDRRWGAALVWVLVGTFFLLPMLGYERPDLWLLLAMTPLLVSVAGVTLVVQAIRGGTGGPGPSGFHAVAVMAGNVRRITAPADGGQAVAVMGGCQIDIAPGPLKDNEMTIEVMAFWGGIEIVIPRGWALVNRVLPILGGVEDKTIAAAPGAPRVIIRGSAIMGGVEVRNSPESSE